MKALLINCSPHKNGCTYTALDEVAKVLEGEGIEVEVFQLGTKPVPGCTACGKCHETGRCIFDDGVNEVIAKLDGIDALVVGSPVYYAAAAGQASSFLDRLFFTAGNRMGGKLGAAVVSCRRGGASAAFDELNKYFSIANMPIVSSCYWNQVHGNTPDEVRQDEEGLYTMRVLGQNMAWLLKSIEAGRAAGVEYPVYGPRKATNFIR